MCGIKQSQDTTEDVPPQGGLGGICKGLRTALYEILHFATLVLNDMGKTNYLQICFMEQNRGTTEHLITCPRKSVGKDNERLLRSIGLWLCAVARVVTRMDTAPLGLWE